MGSGRALVGIEECEVWPDGRKTWVSTTKAPLRDQAGAVIGIFGMSRDITTRKLADDLLAAQAATLAEQAQMLRDLAARDELTGLLNRRGFSEAATRSLELARQESLHATMLFIDLDGLKQINDRSGHAVGDRALIAVANALRTLTGAQRIAGRVGGDEFCILETAPPRGPVLDRNGRPDRSHRRRNRLRPTAAGRLDRQGRSFPDCRPEPVDGDVGHRDVHPQARPNLTRQDDARSLLGCAAHKPAHERPLRNDEDDRDGKRREQRRERDPGL